MKKLKIREQSIKYATAKKVEMSRREGELEKEINFLQNFIESNEINPSEKTEMFCTLEARKRELEKIIEYRTKGSILRARCRWYNEREKDTKYFLNLEKGHFKQSAITQLKVDDENFVTTDKEILNPCEAFYRNLYSSKIDSPNGKYDHIFFEASTVKKLNQLEQDSCEGLLTKSECLKALKEMDSNKTPGSDGLPAEFYKMFWNDIDQTGQLSVSQKREIIKLIPKKDAELYLVKNWRPVSLLNCDYKLATKAVANRLKLLLPKLIDND